MARVVHVRTGKFIATFLDTATMFESFTRRTVLFYVARCHGDLTWYLSMNTLTPAANDIGVASISTAGPYKPTRHLQLVTSPSE